MDNSLAVALAVLTTMVCSTPASAQWFHWGPRPTPWPLASASSGPATTSVPTDRRRHPASTSSRGCSVYTASSNAQGWLFGGGFGVATAPVGNVRFDLSASVNRLSGESDTGDTGTWKGAGPVVGVRLGASVPLFGGR